MAIYRLNVNDTTAWEIRDDFEEAAGRVQQIVEACEEALEECPDEPPLDAGTDRSRAAIQDRRTGRAREVTLPYYTTGFL